jgi:hypothetical protein
LVWLALSRIPQVVPLALVKVVVAVALLVVVALGEANVLLVLLVSHRAIMSRSSMVVVGQLHPMSWYMCFEKRPFWKQWMMSSSVMLAMVACISKKHWVLDRSISFSSYLTWDRSWRVSAQIMDPWKLSIKAHLRSSQESMEFGLRLSSQVRGADSKAIWK